MSSSQRSFSIVVVFQNVGKFLFRTIIFPDTKSTPVWRTRTANIAISIDTIEQLLVLSCPIRSLGGFCVLSVPDDSASLRKSFSSSVSRRISAYYLRSQPDEYNFCPRRSRTTIFCAAGQEADCPRRSRTTTFCPRRSRTTTFCAPRHLSPAEPDGPLLRRTIAGGAGLATSTSVPGGAGRPPSAPDEHLLLSPEEPDDLPGGAGRPRLLSPAEPDGPLLRRTVAGGAGRPSSAYYRRTEASWPVLSPGRSLLTSTVPGQGPPTSGPFSTQISTRSSARPRTHFAHRTT